VPLGHLLQDLDGEAAVMSEEEERGGERGRPLVVLLEVVFDQIFRREFHFAKGALLSVRAIRGSLPSPCRGSSGRNSRSPPRSLLFRKFLRRYEEITLARGEREERGDRLVTTTPEVFWENIIFREARRFVFSEICSTAKLCEAFESRTTLESLNFV
jgi:hypothetical protein